MKKITVFCCIMFSVNVSGTKDLPFGENGSDIASYMQSIEKDLKEFHDQNILLKEENKTLEKKVKNLEKERNIREKYVEEVGKNYNNEKIKNEELSKVLSEKNQEIKKLKEKIEISNLPTEVATEVVLNLNDRKEISEDLKQDIIKYISCLQHQAVAKIQELHARVEDLSEENDELKEQIFNMTLDRSISRIEGLRLSDEIEDNFTDQNSSSMILKDLDSEINCKQELSENDDWGLFFRKDSTTDNDDFLQLKKDSFLVNGKLVDDTFSLFHKSDYIRFGFEHWYKLVEFKLSDDICGEFSLSKSDFLNRQQMCYWWPGRLFQISSKKEGKDDSVIITKDFVYKGESKNSVPNGVGVMLKSTGEVLTGKFENSEFIR